MSLPGGVDKLAGRVDHLAQRVGHLSKQLAQETAATRLARWASRHPPQVNFVRQIGDGNTGSVHEVSRVHQPSERVAVKRVAWSTQEQRQSVAKRVATEISVLQGLQHPLLPTLHQVYTTGEELCMEMTLCSRGTLWHARQEAGGRLQLDLVRQYAAELVCVLSHLHDNGVVYVDLKPENVLLQDCGHIMLCDMDLAHTQQEIQHIRDLEAVGASEGASFWGTLEYVAPEVVMSGAAAYSPAADWWGLGVLIYELLLGLAPWDADSEEGILEQIKEADVVWPPAGMLTPDTEDLLHGLLTWDPDQRLGAAGPHQLQQHPFFATTHWGSMLTRIQQDQAAQAEATRAQWRQASASGAGSPAGSGSYDSGGSGKGSGSGSSGEGSTARLGGFFSTVGSGGAGGSIIVRGSRRRFAASGSRAASAGAAREGGYSYSRMERSQEEQQRDAPVTHTW